MEYDPMCGFAPAKEPEHYDGEPFTGTVAECCGKYLPNGYKLVYTGEKRRKRNGEWWDMYNKGVEAAYCDENPDDSEKWILRAVPVEPVKPEWMPGQYAMHEREYGIVRLLPDEFPGEDGMPVVTLDGKCFVRVNPVNLRPLVAADWTREIGGVKVRAYEYRGKHIRLCFVKSGKSDWIPAMNDNGFYDIMREFCRLVSLPIMPYSLHQGDMRAPE